jgi:O-antigen ligase
LTGITETANVHPMNAARQFRPAAHRPPSAGLSQIGIGALVAVSVIAVGISGGTSPLVIWIAILIVTLAYGRGARRTAVGPMLVAFWLSYPEAVVGMDALTSRAIFEILLLACITVFVRPAIKCLQFRWTDKLLILGWVLWGALAYAPVLIGYIAAHHLGVQQTLFRGVPNSTSGLKSVIPVLGAALAFKAGAIIGAGRRETRALREATFAAATLVVVVSWAAFVSSVNLVPFWEGSASEPGRLHSFASPDPNNFGRTLLIPALLICSWILFGAPGIWKRALLPLALVVIALLLTLSRTSYVSLLVGFGVLGLLAAKRFRFWLFGTLGAVALTIIFFAAGLNVTFAPGSERRSVQNLESRIEIWKGVIELMKLKPWFGAHPTGYTYQMWARGIIPEGEFLGSHNVYLWLAADYGIPMALFALLVIIRAGLHGWRAWKCRVACFGSEDVRPMSAFVMASSAAFLVHGITETVPPTFLFFLLGLGVAIHGRSFHRAQDSRAERPPWAMSRTRLALMASIRSTQPGETRV